MSLLRRIAAINSKNRVVVQEERNFLLIIVLFSYVGTKCINLTLVW